MDKWNGGGSDNNVYDDGKLSKKFKLCRFMKAYIVQKKRDVL